MAPVSRAVWRFGVFELDAEARELRRGGVVVHLQPQALCVLTALVQRPGAIVPREDLRRLLWGGETFVSFDRSLNYCLSSLRRALRDDARSPRFVETVAGRGYRFIAPVAGPPGKVAPPAPARPPEPASGMRSAVALAAVVLLVVSLSPRRPEPRDPTAQALYAEARVLCGEGGWRRSIPLYRAALAHDPRFAAAHAGLAESYLALGESGSLDPGQAFPSARDAARRALALEDRADARLVLGRVLFAYDWDWPGAERTLRRALRLEPSSIRARVSLARLLSARGDHDAAIELARRAEALDPSAPDAVEELAWCYYRARRLDEAARQFRLVAARRPEDAHHLLFALFRQAGRHREALVEAGAVMLRAGVPERDRLALARLAPEAAATAYLRGAVAHFRREASRHRVAPERIALLHAALGEREVAIEWLTRAVDERSPGLVTALADPGLDPVRGEPAFRSLVRRVGSPALPSA